MRSLLKATLLAATLLATGTVINAQVSIGIVIAPPPPARRLWLCQKGQLLSSRGLRAIGILWETITSGMKAIGLDRPTRGLTGLDRTTTANGTTQVTGKEIAAVLTTITTRTTATTGITTNTASTTTTINSAR